MDQEPVTSEISHFTHQAQEPVLDNINPNWKTSGSILPEELSNGSNGVETAVALHCPDDSEGVITEDDNLALSNDGMSEFSNSDISLPEVCISSNSKSLEEEMNYEVQQAYRIFSEFLSEKHKVITSPFLHPIGNQESQYGIGGVRSRGQAHLRQSMCLCRMEEKFINQDYENITEFVADFRLMLENCYRYHGVDHWLSKQAQKLEVMLEQKLTLLSRTLREKTTIGVTSKGRFGVEEERISTMSTRRRQAPRTLKVMTVGGHESVMVQTLRVEEQQRAKEEKRQRELEKKEAEEMSAKEMDEWEQSLLSQASPHSVETLWELPAIGHFLCLAQTALNLPEIVFFELERCLLMPRCSILLSKIMSSLLCPPQRRSTLHRRPVLPYRRWDFELRQRVKGWYQSISESLDQAAQAEQLGLCHQFFNVLGEVNPLETKAFHMLPFYERLWLLKGLCDNVYETQKDIQDAVLAQPIHECRESILGYDSRENAYIHFPHFCGADLRIYWQSPCTPPTFPFPSVLVKKEVLHKLDEEVSHIVKETQECSRTKHFDESTSALGHTLLKVAMNDNCKRETTDGKDDESCHLWKLKKGQIHLRGTNKDKSKVESNIHTKTFFNPVAEPIRKHKLKNDTAEFKSKRLKIKEESTTGSFHRNETVIHEPCLSVGEHCYTGRSPACSVTVSLPEKLRIKTEGSTQEDQKSPCLDSSKNKIEVKVEQCQCDGESLGIVPHLSSENTCTFSEERVNSKIWTKKKKQKKKRGKDPLLQIKRDTRRKLSRAKPASVQKRSTAIKRKDNKKHQGKKVELSKKIKHEPQAEPSFKLVCTNLDDLRELINKTEDELDDLESTKKRLSRWHYRRKSVKDLHSTLIRLLNELSPWEPKLIKAYQRNRLRLKKECEVFRNHPEYNNFVREECISSSSSDDEEGGELGLLSEQCRQSGQEDEEHVVPRGLWIGAALKEASELVEERPLTHICQQGKSQSIKSDCLDQNDTLNHTCKSELNQQWKPSGSNASPASCVPLHTALPSKDTFMHTVSGQPKGYKPIPTLLAKSVGNKVTLMKQPNYPEVNTVNGENNSSSLFTKDVPVVATTSLSKTSSASSDPPQISQQKLEQNSHQIQTLKQPVMGTLVPTDPQSRTTEDSRKKNIQVLYSVKKDMNHLVSQSSTNQRNEDIVGQQVIVLPPNLLVHKIDDNVALFQQQSKNRNGPKTKMETTLCMPTNMPGFTIPEKQIIVQPVAPLKDAGKTMTSLASSSTSSYLTAKQTAVNIARPSGTQHCDVQTSIPQHAPNNSHVASAPPGLTKTTDSKQELKTVCIRESQSILVTTRGGNTGIVKVQKSLDQTGSSSISPVITISPQFQAFLISKTAPTFSSTSQSTATTSTITSRPTVQTQMQIPSLLKSPSTVISQHTSHVSSSVAQGVQCSAGYTLTTTNGQPMLSASSALLKNTVQHSNFVTSASSTTAELASKPHVNQTNRDDRSQVAKFVLVNPTSSSSHNVNVSCTKTLPSSIMLISQPTANSSLMPLQGPNTVQKQARTRRQQTTLPSRQKMAGQTVTTVNKMSLPKNKDVSVAPGAATNSPKQFPEVMSTVRQGTAVQPQSSSKSRDPKQISTSIGQIPVTNSNSLPAPASSLTSLKHLGISSVTMISQAGTVTCPCPSKSFSVLNSNKNHILANMFSSTSNVYTATSQSIPNPISAPSMTHPALSDLFISDTSGCVDKTFVSSQLPFTKSQDSSTISAEITGSTGSLSTTTTNVFTTSSSHTVQQQLVINTSSPLAGGTHIVFNNTHFLAPPQGLAPGSHVLVISSHAPQVPCTNATTTGATVPQYQGVNHVTMAPEGPILLQSSTRLPSMSAITSPFVACSPAVAPLLEANRPSVPAGRLTGPNSTLLANKTNVVARLPLLQATQLGKPAEGASIVSPLQRADTVLPLVSAVLTNTSTVGSSIVTESLTTITPTSVSSVSNLSPPPLSSTLLHRAPTVAFLSPIKDGTVTATPSSQGFLSTTYSMPAFSTTALASQIPSQHPTIRFASICTSPSTALKHLGLSSTLVHKQEPSLIQPALTGARTTNALPPPSVPLILNQASRMRPPTSSTVKSFESEPLPHDSVAQSDTIPNTTASTHPPAIVTNSAAEKHLFQTSAVGMHSTVASKLLISPDGAVLSTVQCKVKSTLPDTPAGFLTSPIGSIGALRTQHLSKPLSQMDTKSDN